MSCDVSIPRKEGNWSQSSRDPPKYPHSHVGTTVGPTDDFYPPSGITRCGFRRKTFGNRRMIKVSALDHVHSLREARYVHGGDNKMEVKEYPTQSSFSLGVLELRSTVEAELLQTHKIPKMMISETGWGRVTAVRTHSIYFGS